MSFRHKNPKELYDDTHNAYRYSILYRKLKGAVAKSSELKSKWGFIGLFFGFSTSDRYRNK